MMCEFLVSSSLCVFSLSFSMLVPYSMDEFAWSKQQTILYNSIILVLLALLASVLYIVVGVITKW